MSHSIKALPAGLLSLVLAAVFFSILSAAVYRAVMKPGDSALGYLRLGAQELRQFVVTLVIGLLAGLILLVGVAAVGLLGVALMGSGGSGATVFRIVGTCLVGAGVFLFLVRLSLAGPQTMATGQINIFGSWSLAGERYWRIVGINALALVLAAVVLLISATIIGLVSAALGVSLEEASKAVMRPNMSSFSAYFTPLVTLWTALASLTGTLAMTIVLAPAVLVYRQRQAEESMDDMDEVF